MREKATRIRIAEFKARLSEYLREVRRGYALTIFDRDTPIARVIPYSGAEVAPFVVRPATRNLHTVKLPPKLAKKVDSLSMLVEERQSER